MGIGASGRVVIEIEPELKRQLHAVLRLEGKNLKSWFLENVEEFLDQHGIQKSLPFVDEQVSNEENP